MKILMISRLYLPHVGGVEKHVESISKSLSLRGHEMTILTGKYDKGLREEEASDGVKIVRFEYPKIKLLGLLSIWLWLFRNRSLIEQSDIIHCHDVFIWYLPFRFVYLNKPVYTTFHGWEGIWPIPWKNVFLKRLAAKLSWGNICVGKYIEKYYGVKSNFLTHGAVSTLLLYSNRVKEAGRTVFIGRLEKDAGVLQFLRWLDNSMAKWSRVNFVGDGPFRKECKKYGRVHGFTDPKPFLKKAEACFASGYLSALEALSYECRLMVGWDNPLKRDYWMLSPFKKWLDSKDTKGGYHWARSQTWQNLADIYLKLWSNAFASPVG